MLNEEARVGNRMRFSRNSRIVAAIAALVLTLASGLLLAASRQWQSPWLRALRLPAGIWLALVPLILILVVVPVVVQEMRRRKRKPEAEPSALTVPEALSRAAGTQAKRAGEFIDRVTDPARREQLGRELSTLQAEGQGEISTLHVAVFGTVSAGKTSLINALIGREVGTTEAVMGTTRHGESHTYELKSVDAAVSLTDTPGLSEAGEGGEAREAEARALAVRADLLLFVVDHDLIRSEYAPLIELARLGKRSIVVLNKKDRFPDEDLAAIQAKLRERLSGAVDPADIVAIAAAPRPMPVRVQRPDGSFDTVLEVEEPDIAALRSRIALVLRREGKFLHAANLLVRGRVLEQEAQEQLARERERQAMDVVEHHQWITAGTVFANPIPALDILAGGAVQLDMIADLARIHGVELSSGQVRGLAGQMVQAVLKLGLVETATSLIAGVFKRTVVGFAAGGAVQAVTMAYLTRVSGKAFTEYFRQNQSWGPEGIYGVVLHQFDQTSRSEFLQNFASQVVERVLRKVWTGTGSSRRQGQGEPMNLFPDDHQTIVGTARRLRSGETTCLDVLQSCLDRIDEKERAVRAWVLVDRDGATLQAQALDAELQAGRDRGPLHGIPIGVKDIIDVKGLPTGCGDPRGSGHVAAEDATIVTRLRDAGAVILGKTVTTAWAWIDPPVTRNPWKLDRTPGGSSSGSAAAVACGMCLGAIGTQTGGSIIRPAAFCGVAGMKPTFGHVSTTGIFPFAPSLDHPGPIARSVDDLMVLYRALCEPEHQGEKSSGGTSRPRVRNYARRKTLRVLRRSGSLRDALGHQGVPELV